MTIKQLLIAGLCCVTPSLIAQTGKIKLSEMDLSSIYQPYGTPAIRQSSHRRTFTGSRYAFCGWRRCTGKQ